MEFDLMTDTQVDNVARFQAAFAAGDKDLLAKLVHPDFHVRQSKNLPYGGSYRGFDGFCEFALGIFPTTWRIDQFDMLHRFDEAVTEPGTESVVLMFHLVGAVAATGEPIDTTLLEHWILKDGKLLSAQPHWFETPGTD
jgi:uncharacterized protein